MRKLFISAILVLFACTILSGQTDKVSPCLTLDLTGPVGTQSPDKPMAFTAELSKEAEKFDLKYRWVVSNGDITEGQGTLIVKVLIKDIKKALTATVEVIGLPKDCPNKRSIAVNICSTPDAVKD